MARLLPQLGGRSALQVSSARESKSRSQRASRWTSAGHSFDQGAAAAVAVTGSLAPMAAG